MSSASQLLFGTIQGFDKLAKNVFIETLYEDLTFDALNARSDISTGITISVPFASDKIIISKPAGLTYKAWSPFSPGEQPDPWTNAFQVTYNNSTESYNTARYTTEQEAEDNFNTVTLTGSTTYIIWLEDTGTLSDNREGLSVKIERKYTEISQETTPIDVFNYQKFGAWYDISDTTTLFKDTSGTIPVTTDGDLVALVLDKSGNTNNLVQSYVNYRPTYRTDGTYHWLESDGDSRFMETKILSNPVIQNGGFISAAWSATNDESTGGVFEEKTSSTDSKADPRVVIYGNTGPVSSNSRAILYLADGSTFSFVNNQIKRSTLTPYVISGNSNGTVMEGRVNGVSQGTASSNTLFPSTTRFVIFRQTRGPLYFTGKFYGAVAFDEELSENDVNSVDNYLAKKSGAVI